MPTSDLIPNSDRTSYGLRYLKLLLALERELNQGMRAIADHALPELVTSVDLQELQCSGISFLSIHPGALAKDEEVFQQIRAVIQRIRSTNHTYRILLGHANRSAALLQGLSQNYSGPALLDITVASDRPALSWEV